MNFDDLFTVVDKLEADELERLKAYIAKLEQPHQQTAEAWGNALESAVAQFRGSSSPEELNEIFAAMNQKSPPSEKEL